MYTFKNICVESPNLELANGATVIFLNAKGINGEVHSDIKNLLDFINGKQAQGRFTENIETKVDEVKRNDRLKVRYMSGYAEEMRIRREERAEGRAEEKLRMIKNLLSAGTPIGFIIKATGWTEEQILELDKFENLQVSLKKILWTIYLKRGKLATCLGGDNFESQTFSEEDVRQVQNY